MEAGRVGEEPRWNVREISLATRSYFDGVLRLRGRLRPAASLRMTLFFLVGELAKPLRRRVAAGLPHSFGLSSGDDPLAFSALMPRVVTFGEIMLRLSCPGHQRFAQATELDVHFGGAEANVAVTIAQLGGDADFVTRLPSNELGQR